MSTEAGDSLLITRRNASRHAGPEHSRLFFVAGQKPVGFCLLGRSFSGHFRMSPNHGRRRPFSARLTHHITVAVVAGPPAMKPRAGAQRPESLDGHENGHSGLHPRGVAPRQWEPSHKGTFAEHAGQSALPTASYRYEVITLAKVGPRRPTAMPSTFSEWPTIRTRLARGTSVVRAFAAK